MDEIKNTLQTKLENNGWVILDRSPGDDWWINEIWKIQSKWTPQDIQFEISFKHDEPQNIWEEKYNEVLIKKGVGIIDAYDPESCLSLCYIFGGKKSFIEKLDSLIESARDYRKEGLRKK